jgi:glycyl-tRNA synthetase beta subunit
MSAQDFLVELGTEELPPKALASLATPSSPVSRKACRPPA